MATGSINLNANLTLNTQSLNAASKQAQQALGRITGQASEFQKSLDASTARVFAFGATTTILNGVSQAFAALISNTIEVEKRINEIGSILGGTSDQLNQLRDSVFAVAKDTGQAFGTVADAAAELARQGLSAEETSKRLSAALILTRVSGLDSVKSVKALTSAINGFTSAGLTAEQITNKLVAVDTKFAVSAQDLADGFSRAGSTAEDAGVSFDELLGIITAVEQKTARGGAVIGNALKSIFARLGRAGTIDDLRELGVEIDSSQTGIQKLQSLSAALEKIADPTVANQIKELAGGVFQINVVSAALKDLGSDTSIFAAAAKTAAGATNEAFTKNAQLNESISAQINSLIVGLVNLSEKIGTITFGPIIKNLLSLANTFSTFLEEALDPEKGNKFIQGLLKTIGAFLSGPGLILITTAFLKIFTLVAKFAKEGFKTILDIGSQSEKIKSIEGGIVGLLSRDQQLRAAIVNTTISQADKQAAIISAIQRENALLTQQEQLLRSIATAAAQRGVAGYSSSGGFSGKGGKRFADGYMAEEATARMLGATSSVKAKQGKGTIGGQKFIMNNQETEIPNFGRNGDSAVIPHYAKGFVPNFAKYIYDSDRIAPDKNATLKAILASKAKKNLIVGPAGSGKSTFAAKAGNFLSGVLDVPKTGANEIDILSSSAKAKDGGFSKNFQEIISSVNASGGKVSYLYAKNLDIINRRAGRTEASEGDLRNQKQLKGTKFAPLNQFDFMSKLKSGSKSFGLLKNVAQGFIPNFAPPTFNKTKKLWVRGTGKQGGLSKEQEAKNEAQINQKTLKKTGSSSVLSDDEKKAVLNKSNLDKAIGVNGLVKKMPTILTPNDNSRGINYNQEYDKTNGVILNYKFDAFAASNKAGLTENFKTNFGSDEIEQIARTKIISQSKVIAEALGLRPAEPDTVDEITKGEGFKGAIRAASGALFEAAVNTTLGLGVAKNDKDQGNFDVRSPTGNGKEKLKELFGNNSLPAPVADFKYSADSTKQSMAGKVYKEYRGKIDPEINNRRNEVKSAFEKALEKKKKQNGTVSGEQLAVGIPTSTNASKTRKPKAASGFIPNYVSPKYVSDTLKRIKEGDSGFSKNEQEKFKNKFKGGKSLPVSSSKGAKISLRQVFDNLDSEIGISNFVDNAYSSAGPTASTEKVFEEFNKQTKLNPAPLRNIVKSKGFVPNFAINGLDANLSNNVLAGRIFEALLRNETSINMTENKVGPDITSGSFAVREAKISGKSAYNDSNFGEGKPKGKGLVLPSNAISDYDDKLIKLRKADILRSNIPTTRLFGLAAEIKKREEDKVTNRNNVPIYAPKGLITKGAAKIKGLKGFASGYIPNFSAINDAISREIGAGVEPSKVYVDQNNSLKNPMNPAGLMVANRRDEPQGGSQGINRAKKEGANIKTYGMARGFIPNFAEPPASGGMSEMDKWSENFAKRLAAIPPPVPASLKEIDIDLSGPDIDATIAAFRKRMEELGATIAPLNKGATEAAKALGAIKPPDIGGALLESVSQVQLPPEKGGGGERILGVRDTPRKFVPAPTVKINGKNIPAGASNVVMAGAGASPKKLPALPQLAAQVAMAKTAGEAVPKGGGGMGGMGGMKSIALQMGLSALPSLLPAIKEEESALKNSAIALTNNVAQYTAMGASFGPMGAAVGALAGGAMTLYDAYQNAEKLQKDGQQIHKDVNAKMRGLREIDRLTASALNLSDTYDEAGNKVPQAGAARDMYKSIMESYKKEGFSSKEISDAKSKAKQVVIDSSSSEEDKAKASEEYTNVLGKAMSRLAEMMVIRAEQAEKLLNFQALSRSLSQFSAVLEKKAVTLDQQKFAEGIASNVTMPANAPYAEATKAAIGIEQKKTLATESKVGFMKEFTGEDFQKNLNMDSIKMDKLKGKSGAEISGAISKDVFSAYMKDGAIGAGKALDGYLKTNLKPEDAKAFKDNIISSAATFKNNVAESMQAALNRETEVQNNLSELIGKIKEAGTKFMAGGSGKINELMSGPKLDVLSLQDKIEEAGRLLKSGKKGDVEKGRDILRQTDGDQKEFAKRYGEEKLVQMQTDAGLTAKDTGLAIGSASMAATDLSGVEKAIRETFAGGELMETMKALKAAQGDPTKIQNFIDTVKKNAVTGSEKKAERGSDIVNSLTGLGKTGSTEKEIAAALAKKQITPERAEKLRERAKKESEQATATEDPESKALQNQQKALNVELETLKTKISELNSLFGDTGIPKAVESLTKSVKDAANNLAGFTDFTKNLSSLSNQVNGRLLDIEKQLGQAGK